ncbi:MAG: hypothetical protein OHK0039_41570 [Bacteroidia bacterium]
MKQTIILAWLLLGSLYFLAAQPTTRLYHLRLRTLEGEAFPVQQWQAHRYTVLFFLSPECPLCQNYSRTIAQLRTRYPGQDLAFYGIFPGTHYDSDEIRAYLDTYSPPVIPLRDPAYHVTRALGAQVTPEAFLLDATGQVLYSGKIDNWIPKLGQKRSVITEYYLQDAIGAALAGRPVPLRHIPAIGCFIE